MGDLRESCLLAEVFRAEEETLLLDVCLALPDPCGNRCALSGTHKENTQMMIPTILYKYFRFLIAMMFNIFRD